MEFIPVLAPRIQGFIPCWAKWQDEHRQIRSFPIATEARGKTTLNEKRGRKKDTQRDQYSPCSRSADSKTRYGDFPPSSKDTYNVISYDEKVERPVQFTFFKLLFAAASMILRPVIVDPVNATLSTSGCAARAAPPTGPWEGTVLMTPGGNLFNRGT